MQEPYRDRNSVVSSVHSIAGVTLLFLMLTAQASAPQARNSAPRAGSAIGEVTARLGDEATRFDLSDYFTDPDGDHLVYRVANPAIVTVAVTGSMMAVTPVAVGTGAATVRATDPLGLHVEQTFTVTVSAADSAPVVTHPIADMTLTVGGRSETVTLSSHFQDPEQGELTFSASSGDTAVSTATVTDDVLTVTAAAAGSASVTVRASDQNGLTSAPAVFTVTGKSPVNVEIPDANLRPVVEQELGKEPGETITSAEMEHIRALEGTELDIEDLRGLEFATGLTDLNLGINAISDLTPLSGLTNLRNLGLRENAITDVTPVSDLTNLEEVDLDNNSLTDLTPLSGLANLIGLGLDWNSLTDVTPLSGLTSLTTLSLDHNSLTDLTPLSGLTNLTRLGLVNNSITDVAPLSGLTGLADLYLLYNSITDVTPLSGLTGLADLYLSNNLLTDLAPLSGMTNLTRLSLFNNEIRDVTPLSGLTNLSRLWLYDNCLTSIQALTNNGGLGAGDYVSLRWNALDADTVADDVTALRDRGVDVVITETPTVEVGAPVNLNAAPGDGELTLTWAAPSGPDVPAYEVRWRSAVGTFNDWTVVPCSSKRRHKLTGLVNGTAYTVELRAAGRADNGVATVGATSGDPSNNAPVVTLSIADVTLTVGDEPAQISLSDHFTDPDGDSLEYSVVAPGIVTVAVSQGTMTVTPVAVGTGAATVRATDPGGLFAELTFTVTVSAADSAPVVTHPIADMTLTVGGRSETVTLSSHFQDPEQGELTFSASSGDAAVVTATLADGVLTVTAVAAGTTEVTVTASDVSGAISEPDVFTVISESPVTVEIPDAYLREAVEQELGKQAGEVIDSAEMEHLNSLSCVGCDIEDLTGLQFATGLTRLELDDNQLTNLTPLAGLPSLAYLSLYESAMTNLTPLSDLTSLATLILSSDVLTDITPLSELTSLATLTLYSQALTDITPLSDLTRLTTLKLGSNAITDPAPLSVLTSLTTLWFYSEGITDLTPLSGLTNLTTLWLRTGATDLAPLSGFTNLTTLDLEDNAITDLAPLSGLTNLTTLYLRHNAFTDLSPLSGLTNLTWLGLANNAITDIEPLSDLTNLTTLRLFVNAITDIEPLSGLSNLTTLSLFANAITDIAPLSGLTQLTGLGLSENAIEDVAPLSGLTQLTGLGLSENAIEDVAPLSGLTNLTFLGLSGNAIVDITPLAGLTNVTALYLADNAITNLAPLSGLTDLTRLGLGWNEIADVAPLSGLTSLTSLGLYNNCITSVGDLTHNTGLGVGDWISLRWNALEANTVANDVTALRDRGVTVLISETPTVEVGAPVNLSAAPGDGELTLTWTAPSGPEVPAYEVRWRSAAGTFNEWTVAPCSSKHRHQLTGLVNGTTYTVELRAAGHADNGVATVDATPGSAALALPVGAMLWADLTAPNDVPWSYEVNPYDGFGIYAAGAWPLRAEDGNLYQPLVYLRELDISPEVHPEEWGTEVQMRLSTSSTGSVLPPPGAFGGGMVFAVHDTGLNEALVDEDGLPLVTAELQAAGDGLFVGALAGDTETFWDAISDSGEYDWSEGLFVELEVTSSVTVIPPTGGPVISRPIADVTLTVGGLSETVILSSHFQDPEQGELTYFVSSGDPAVVTTAIADGVLTVTAVASGATDVTVTASDLAGATSVPAVFTVTAESPVIVEIPDAYLREAVEQELGKQAGEVIDSAEMEHLNSLSCVGCDIEDLTGLQFATGLTRLELDDNQLTNLTPLAGLPSLAYLSLYESAMTNLTPLSDLTSLATLILSSDVLTDITPLSELTSLATLTLYSQALTDITPLSDLTRLTTLKLGSNAITDPAPLSVLTSLTTLWFYSEGITDLTPLSGLTNLTTLWLRTGATDLAPLSGFTNLTTLDLEDNAITDLAPLSGLTNLTTLYLRHNAFTDLSPLSGLTNLTWLGLANNAITDIEPLSDLTNLTTLRLFVNAITDIEPLSGLSNLTTLSLFANAITDIAPLSGLTQLTGLGLSENAIEDVAPLSGLTQLTGLGLSENAIEDVAPLSGLTNLTFLGLSGNAIVDITPLAGLTNVTALYLADNAITNLAPLSGLTDLTRLGLGWNEIADVAPLSGLTSLTSLGLYNNCITSVGDLTHNTGLGVGDWISLRWNALEANTVANDVTALRDRGVTVLISETPTVEVGAPVNLSAAPGDGELTLTWTAPSGPEVPAYEVRWRSAAGTFNEWTVAPCSSKHRHQLTGLVNGTTYTVELRAAGHADNGVATVSATPSSSDSGL